jgi:hypothetical protein
MGINTRIRAIQLCVEQELVDSLNACGGNAQYTVKTGVVIPGEIFAQSELYEWFLAQSKK